jgi:hypothetical protein
MSTPDVAQSEFPKKHDRLLAGIAAELKAVAGMSERCTDL